MEESINWLMQNRIVLETNNKFSLTEYGEKLIKKANSKTNVILEIRKNLEMEINEKLMNE